MQCQNCGSPIVEKRQAYCYRCGARLRSSAVPTILGCGLSVLLGVLGCGVVAVCGALAFLATCAYGLSNNTGPKPDLAPYSVGAIVGVLLMLGAVGATIYGIVAGWRGAARPTPVLPPAVGSPPLPPILLPPAPLEHRWIPAPPVAPESEIPPPAASSVWDGDPDPPPQA